LRRGRPRLKDTSAIDPTTEPSAFPDVPVEPFLILLALGFALGGVGHLFGLRVLVALGVLLVVAATVVVPAVFYFVR
jgi:hypothetical protein